MKKSILAKQVLFTAVAITGMNLYTSCNRCNRDKTEENTTVTDDRYGSDTLNNTETTDTSASFESSAPTTGSTNKTASSAASHSTTKPATAGTSNTTTSSSGKKNTISEEEATNEIENSDAPANRNGKPINSGGSMGSGSGTGTGSTGNNSRVTSREAQKN